MTTTAVDIPVIDVGPWLRGVPGAGKRTAGMLRHALEDVGFYFVVNHTIPARLIGDIFDETRRFHAQPLERKFALRLNRHNIGYLPVASSVSRASTLDPVKKRTSSKRSSSSATARPTIRTSSTTSSSAG